MRRIVAIVLGAGLSLTAGQALACPYPHHPHHHGPHHHSDDDAYDGRAQSWRYEEHRYEDRYAPPPLIGASAWYMDGRHPKPPCDCEPAGSPVQLSGSFFNDAGGVGPSPDGGWYGGDYYVAGSAYGYGYGYGHASARSVASASASATVTIRGGRHFGGGYSRGGHSKGGKN